MKRFYVSVSGITGLGLQFHGGRLSVQGVRVNRRIVITHWSKAAHCVWIVMLPHCNRSQRRRALSIGWVQ